MKVILLRHAPTAGNLLSQYIGCTDQPLSPEGVELADRIEKNHSMQRVYSSTLQRAAQTAAILYPQTEIHKHPELAEMNFGKFEGKNWQELTADRDYAIWLKSGCEARCPGGEKKDEFTRRCCQGFLAIVRKEQDLSASELHMVLHGGVIMAILGCLANPAKEYFGWQAEFCGGYVLQCDLSLLPRPLTVTGIIASPYRKE